jgi:hypothetical protein
MKKQIHIFQKITLLVMTTLFIYSCSNDKDETPEENLDALTLTTQDVQTVLQTDVIVGVADNLLSSLFLANGNTGKSNETNDCYTREDTTTGYILTFTGCILDGTPNVRGIIQVDYATESQMPSYTATYTNFYVGDIKIDGTRSFVFDGEINGSNLTFSVTSTMNIVLEDGTLVTENGTRSFGFIIGNTLNDTVITLNGSWNLTIGSDVYTASITNTLETKIACAYISEGEMSLDKNGLTIGINFGDGSCDNSATITYPNGATQEVLLDD